MAFNVVAFDLIDTHGRKFPLLLEFRPDNGYGDAYAYGAAGALVSRDSAQTILATIRCAGEQRLAALEMTDESASFFATYAPHGDVKADCGSPEDREDKWVSLWAAVNQPGACEHAASSDSEVLAIVTQPDTGTLERHGHVVLKEVRTLCCIAGELCSLEPKEFSMFSAYHPPAVVRSFTVAALSPVLLSVPSDVLGIIADYAWMELPYLPMSDEEFELEWSSVFYRTVEDIEDIDDMEP